MEQSLQVLEWIDHGRTQQVAEDLKDLLEIRFGTVPSDVAQRIDATTDLATLKRWFTVVASAKSLKQACQSVLS
jgi:hypothetical protein